MGNALEEKIRNLQAGLNANLTPTQEIKEAGRIRYKSGNELSFEFKRDSPGGFVFTYHTADGRSICLNDLVGKEGWRFIPVEDAFMVCLAENGMVLAYPEIHLSIPALKGSEKRIFSALHEIGHARFFGQILDTYSGISLPGKVSAAVAGNLVAYAKATDKKSENIASLKFERRDSLGEIMIGAIIELVGRIGEKSYNVMNERVAWTYGWSAIRKLGILEGFSKAELRDFYRKNLGSYGPEFVQPCAIARISAGR